MPLNPDMGGLTREPPWLWEHLVKQVLCTPRADIAACRCARGLKAHLSSVTHTSPIGQLLGGHQGKGEADLLLADNKTSSVLEFTEYRGWPPSAPPPPGSDNFQGGAFNTGSSSGIISASSLHISTPGRVWKTCFSPSQHLAQSNPGGGLGGLPSVSPPTALALLPRLVFALQYKCWCQVSLSPLSTPLPWGLKSGLSARAILDLGSSEPSETRDYSRQSFSLPFHDYQANTYYTCNIEVFPAEQASTLQVLMKKVCHRMDRDWSLNSSGKFWRQKRVPNEVQCSSDLTNPRLSTQQRRDHFWRVSDSNF